jgi:hypothetical protein
MGDVISTWAVVQAKRVKVKVKVKVKEKEKRRRVIAELPEACGR